MHMFQRSHQQLAINLQIITKESFGNKIRLNKGTTPLNNKGWRKNGNTIYKNIPIQLWKVDQGQQIIHQFVGGDLREKNKLKT